MRIPPLGGKSWIAVTYGLVALLATGTLIARPWERTGSVDASPLGPPPTTTTLPETLRTEIQPTPTTTIPTSPGPAAHCLLAAWRRAVRFQRDFARSCAQPQAMDQMFARPYKSPRPLPLGCVHLETGRHQCLFAYLDGTIELLVAGDVTTGYQVESVTFDVPDVEHTEAPGTQEQEDLEEEPSRDGF